MSEFLRQLTPDDKMPFEFGTIDCGVRFITQGDDVEQDMINKMVDRFLNWTLPDDFAPDCGITFTKPPNLIGDPHVWPVGTNLLTAQQARAMVAHMLDGTVREERDRTGLCTVREAVDLIRSVPVVNASPFMELGYQSDDGKKINVEVVVTAINDVPWGLQYPVNAHEAVIDQRERIAQFIESREYAADGEGRGSKELADAVRGMPDA
jgi:hypothetical protein